MWRPAQIALLVASGFLLLTSRLTWAQDPRPVEEVASAGVEYVLQESNLSPASVRLTGEDEGLVARVAERLHLTSVPAGEREECGESPNHASCLVGPDPDRVAVEVGPVEIDPGGREAKVKIRRFARSPERAARWAEDARQRGRELSEAEREEISTSFAEWTLLVMLEEDGAWSVQEVLRLMGS